MEIEAEDRADPVRDNCGGRRVRGRRAYAVAFSIVLVLAVISMASMLTAALLAPLVGGCITSSPAWTPRPTVKVRSWKRPWQTS